MILDGGHRHPRRRAISAWVRPCRRLSRKMVRVGSGRWPAASSTRCSSSCAMACSSVEITSSPPQVAVGQQPVAAARFAAVVSGKVGGQPIQIGPRIVDRLAVIDPSRLEPHRLDHVLGAVVAPRMRCTRRSSAGRSRISSSVREAALRTCAEPGRQTGGTAHATPVMRISHILVYAGTTGNQPVRRRYWLSCRAAARATHRTRPRFPHLQQGFQACSCCQRQHAGIASAVDRDQAAGLYPGVATGEGPYTLDNHPVACSTEQRRRIAHRLMYSPSQKVSPHTSSKPRTSCRSAARKRSLPPPGRRNPAHRRTQAQPARHRRTAG